MKTGRFWNRSAGLIPRYNWDFSLRDLETALLGAIGRNGVYNCSLREVFGPWPIFTASGRASLFAILKALGLVPGAQVGVPLFCCPVVFQAVEQAGFRPRFIDVAPEDFNMSVADLGRKQASLAAVVVVHMFGQPADLAGISRVCRAPLIEDCAQSLFSTCDGQPTGKQCPVAFFSFRSGKYLSVGEASVIVCRDSRLREAIERLVEGFNQTSLPREVLHYLSTYFKSALYHRPWYGAVSYHLGKLVDKKLDLTAKSGFEAARITRGDLAVLEGKLTGFQDRVDQQRRNALYLLDHLKVRHAVLPTERPGCKSNYYQFALRFRNTQQRNFAASYLHQCGVDAAKYLDEVVSVAKESYGYAGDCPQAEQLSKTTLVIPHYYSLSQGCLARVCCAVNEADERMGSPH